MRCPGCEAQAVSQAFDGHYGRVVVLDICGACQGLWFDEHELLQLSPGGTLALLRVVSDLRAATPAPHGDLRCPRCGEALVATTDLQRNTRFHYARCPKGHGRFMTFFQFLRARSVVRTLSDAEVRSLREHVRQVNCSNCGGPVDVDRGASCGHCRTPISIVDPDALATALAALDAADSQRQTVDHALPIRLLQERLRVERAFGPDEAGWFGRRDASPDLVRAGLTFVRRWLG